MLRERPPRWFYEDLRSFGRNTARHGGYRVVLLVVATDAFDGGPIALAYGGKDLIAAVRAVREHGNRRWLHGT